MNRFYNAKCCTYVQPQVCRCLAVVGTGAVPLRRCQPRENGAVPSRRCQPRETGGRLYRRHLITGTAADMHSCTVQFSWYRYLPYDISLAKRYPGTYRRYCIHYQYPNGPYSTILLATLVPHHIVRCLVRYCLPRYLGTCFSNIVVPEYPDPSLAIVTVRYLRRS